MSMRYAEGICCLFADIKEELLDYRRVDGDAGRGGWGVAWGGRSKITTWCMPDVRAEAVIGAPPKSDSIRHFFSVSISYLLYSAMNRHALSCSPILQ